MHPYQSKVLKSIPFSEEESIYTEVVDIIVPQIEVEVTSPPDEIVEGMKF